MASEHSLPKTMKALVLDSFSQPPEIKTVPTPEPTIGSAIVRIISANVLSYSGDVYSGKRQYPYPTPFTPGVSAVVRITALGPDATKLNVGDLAFLDPLVRSRDAPEEAYLAGLHQGMSKGSAKLAADVYRDWTYAEYARVPLEVLTAFNEKRLTGSPAEGGLGYAIDQLAYISALGVPYGGLRDIDLKVGETIIVAPATGPFGGAAVLMCLAMGARVIAFGRNTAALEAVKQRVPYPDRVATVPITGDMMHDLAELKKAAAGPIDAFFDIGPPEASKSTHLKSAILALRHGGRVSLMGGYKDDIPLPHNKIMHWNIRIFGKWMYERSDVTDLVRLIESGILKLGKDGGVEVVGTFPLEEWNAAFDMAAEQNTMGRFVLIKP
ncbi:hypothetical protein BAUCODRAFT_110218 [Baudoinia panamericana UAMH 10762]|uniref:Alcohol dehydrogenase-like C-terminal domain-containing protein n=1 Tax=Baudoinia panamericana (strain UAMH 10762) TaxID=717646 RepID=M2MEN8_BAUPA|nr:uncharacterized protein BAUCODRAFT_110218 [Baudoinia panamericana UAMH 10762]EMC95031.1 hypothetical protein BAUCODRAFT_110218 [Baudoinia panamericana UAMH 10762]